MREVISTDVRIKGFLNGDDTVINVRDFTRMISDDDLKEKVDDENRLAHGYISIDDYLDRWVNVRVRTPPGPLD